MARRAPHVSLRPYVLEYVGWFEHMAQPLCRREVPTEVVPVIISFGAPVRIFDQQDQNRWLDFTSFTTGAFDTYVLVGSAGASGGLQINLSILGARLFLGRPLGELANRVVALEDLFGAAADRLVSRLREARTWDTRFDTAEQELRARILSATLPPPAIVWAWRRLGASHGGASVGGIVAEVGWSQKHLVSQFREHIGLTPKSLARVLRFGRAVELIKSAAPRRLKLTEIALDCGYYDQAHFTRDFRTFAGVTPTELVASTLPDSAGFSVDR